MGISTTAPGRRSIHHRCFSAKPAVRKSRIAMAMVKRNMGIVGHRACSRLAPLVVGVVKRAATSLRWPGPIAKLQREIGKMGASARLSELVPPLEAFMRAVSRIGLAARKLNLVGPRTLSRMRLNVSHRSHSLSPLTRFAARLRVRTVAIPEAPRALLAVLLHNFTS